MLLYTLWNSGWIVTWVIPISIKKAVTCSLILAYTYNKMFVQQALSFVRYTYKFNMQLAKLLGNTEIFLFRNIYIIRFKLIDHCTCRVLVPVTHRYRKLTVGSKNIIWTVEMIFCPVNCQTCKSWTFTIPGKASSNSLLRESMFMWLGIVWRSIRPDSFTTIKIPTLSISCVSLSPALFSILTIRIAKR